MQSFKKQLLFLREHKVGILGIKATLLNIYDKKYKTLMIFTFIIFLLAIGILITSYVRTGEFVQKGVTLKGGITLTIQTNEEIDLLAFENKLASELPKADISVRKTTELGVIKAIIIEAGDVEEKELLSAVEETGIIKLKEGEYSVESMGSSLGTQFFKQTIIAVIIAYIAMWLVVLLTFRELVPSTFVMLAATANIICSLAVVSLIGMKLSTAGVAAFLMLIGYASDTNIMLTTKVLRRKEGTVLDRILSSMKTGMTMTATTLVAATVAYFFSTSDVIKQIMIIMIIGLVFDVLNTWVQNTGILRWYLERKARKAEAK